MAPSTDQPEFDQFAQNYESLFKLWLRIAGSSREHFARARIRCLAALLKERDTTARHVMDFGCGTGISIPLLLEILGAEEVIGVDPSRRSLDIAAQTVATSKVRLLTPEEYEPRADLDLVFSNGVFHHIPIEERETSLAFVYDSLRPGGVFALWENNPWNPIVLYSMKTTELDKNAIPITPPRARQLARNKFTVVRTDYLFFFPAYLRILQRLEKSMVKVPIGAQYQVLLQKT
jgi:trans-aconitate methyltransferase